MIRAPKLSQRFRDRARGAARAFVARTGRMTADELREHTCAFGRVELPVVARIKYSKTHAFESCRLEIADEELGLERQRHNPHRPNFAELANLEALIVRQYVRDYIERRYLGRTLYDWSDKELAVSILPAPLFIGSYTLDTYDREQISAALTSCEAQRELAARETESSHERIARLAATEQRAKKGKAA